MRNTLLIKLLGAFLLIIVIGGLVTSLHTSNATLSAFELYTTRSGQIWAERLAPDLADYYLANNSWDGVDAWLASNLLTQQSGGESMSSMMGGGNGEHGPGGGQHFGDSEMMGELGQRLLLADQHGDIIYDSQSELVGSGLSDAQLEKGTPILVDSETVGTLLITSGDTSGIASAAEEFHTSVHQAVIQSAIFAGILALILGTLLFIQITAPMRKLRKAAAAIAAGDLSQRVDIKSRDEFGELGQTFNQMAENLAQAEVQRRHLMADVAHELRTPLTAIQGTLEGMQDGVLPCDKEQLDALYAETTLLNRLIGDLRLLSLAEASQLKLELAPTDLAELIRQIAERTQPQAKLKEILLETKINLASSSIRLDPDRITQVFNNLIGNALRYTPQGGTITLEAFQDLTSSSIRLSVSDTGQGIDPQNLPHVFDRFFRADKSRTRSSGGSGLGLAIVKELVEAHGGSVSAESPIFFDANHQGYGTRFTLTLPDQQ